MGVCAYPTLEKEIEGIRYETDEKITNYALRDLNEMQKVLLAARAQNLKWYLAIDF